jgi:hypothetical protein
MNDPCKSVYIFSYFKGHGDGLHLAWSVDGYRWDPLNDDKPFVFPEIGPEKLMRDPFLLPGRDGYFHLVWTAGWRGKGIGYARSTDLVTWLPQRWLGVMEAEEKALNCWAPEIFFDDRENRYLIYWATSIPGRYPDTDHLGDEGLNHRMYCVFTKDFSSFGKTQLLFDAGFNVIDATLLKDNDRYLLFCKDETSTPCQKNIRMSTSHSLFGFKEVSGPITGSYWAEGPSAVRLADQWIVYFDKYKLNTIGAVASRDLIHWQDVSDQVHFPTGAQHGSVVQIPFERIKHLF